MVPIDPEAAIPKEFCPDCGTPRAGRFRFCMKCGVDFDWLDANFEPPGGPFSPIPPGGWPTAATIAAGIKAANKKTRRPKTPKGQPAPEPGMPVVNAPAAAPAMAAATPPAAAPTPIPVTTMPIAALGTLSGANGTTAAGPTPAAAASTAPAPVAAGPMADLRVAAAPVDDARIGARKPGMVSRIAASRLFLPRGFAPITIGLLLGLGVASYASTANLPIRADLEAFAQGLIPSAPPQVAVEPSPSVEPSATPEPTPEPVAQGPLPDVQPGPGAVTARVTQVFDGNTIMVALDGTEQRVRYLDVVLPDASTPDGAAAAIDAARLNESMVGGNDVLLESDVTDRDDAGRLLRHVWVQVDGKYQLVGAWLVVSGVAQREVVEPDIAYRDVYDVAQDYARRLALGIWGTQVAELPETGPSASPDPSAEPAETPGPTPITALRTYTSTEPVVVLAEGPTSFDGTIGRFVWRDVSFVSPVTSVQWSVTSKMRAGCLVTWHVEPEGGTPTKVDVPVAGIGEAKGKQALDTTSAQAQVIVESTCPNWTLRMRGVEN